MAKSTQSKSLQDDALEILRVMLVIRRFEERLIRAHADGNFRGIYHVYIGQELTGAVALSMLQKEDIVFTTHRNHGHVLARGGDPVRVFAEILGRAAGYNRGRGGTLHVAAKEIGIPFTSAIVGSGMPLALGSALAASKLNTDGVTVCIFGDGSMEEGAFPESLNIAKLWKLPAIFLCENNSKGTLTPAQGGASSSTIAAAQLCDIPKAFQIPSVTVDGTRADEIRAVMKEAIDRARSKQGPTFIEVQTVRWPGSRVSPPQLVDGLMVIDVAWDLEKAPGENAQWFKSDDPLLAYAREAIGKHAVSVDDLTALDREVSSEIEQAFRAALESPDPELSDAYKYVYA